MGGQGEFPGHGLARAADLAVAGLVVFLIAAFLLFVLVARMSRLGADGL